MRWYCSMLENKCSRTKCELCTTHIDRCSACPAATIFYLFIFGQIIRLYQTKRNFHQEQINSYDSTFVRSMVVIFTLTVWWIYIKWDIQSERNAIFATVHTEYNKMPRCVSTQLRKNCMGTWRSPILWSHAVLRRNIVHIYVYTLQCTVSPYFIGIVYSIDYRLYAILYATL